MTVSKETDQKIVENVITKLEDLKSHIENKSKYDTISVAAQELLFAVFKAGVFGVNFTPEDKHRIISLIPAAIKGLGYRLFTLQNSFSSFCIDTIRIERSGLQYLLDNYSEFPADPKDRELLVYKLNDFAYREDLEGLDDYLKICEFDYYSESLRGKELLAAIEKLPKNHWWFNDDYDCESVGQNWGYEKPQEMGYLNLTIAT